MKKTDEILNNSIQDIEHILDSGANKIRLFELINRVAKKYSNEKLNEAEIIAYKSSYSSDTPKELSKKIRLLKDLKI